MIHPDGIEVYLKPRGEGSDDLRFPEIESPDGTITHPSRKYCAVPVLDKEFNIVIRFSDEFKQYSATGVYARVTAGWGQSSAPPTDEPRPEYQLGILREKRWHDKLRRKYLYIPRDLQSSSRKPRRDETRQEPRPDFVAHAMIHAKQTTSQQFFYEYREHKKHVESADGLDLTIEPRQEPFSMTEWHGELQSYSARTWAHINTV